MNIFICCTSSKNVKSNYLEEAKKIGAFLAHNDYDLVMGGYNDTGIFSALIKEFKNRDINIYTLSIYDEDIPKYINYTYVNSTYDRTKMCFDNSDKILILPGGTGTFSEIFGMLEEIRTYKIDKEIIIFNLDNYYVDLIKLINSSIKNEYNNKNILDYFKVFNTSDDLINYLGGRV